MMGTRCREFMGNKRSTHVTDRGEGEFDVWSDLVMLNRRMAVLAFLATLDPTDVFGVTELLAQNAIQQSVTVVYYRTRSEPSEQKEAS